MLAPHTYRMTLRLLLSALSLVWSISLPAMLEAQSFNSSSLSGESLTNPTSLQFGPDGRLYVSVQNGLIYAYSITRNSPNSYQVTATETINLVQNIPNHDDDGSASSQTERQVTGILVAGTATNPVLYVTSSDPRIGGGGAGSDLGLDTNSGIVSRLTWTGSAWDKVDLVRGLPRSEENHASHGMTLDNTAGILYLAQGGNTNAGSPSNNFAFLSEYALSGAILAIDLNVIDTLATQGSGNTKYKYDLPTLDDPDRSGNPDAGDPFGGNDGLNMAKIVPGGPVQIHAPGFRNHYDLVRTSAGRLYTIDNGPNGGWGGHPAGEGSTTCTNQYLSGEPGSTGPGPGGDPQVNNRDGLHFIPGPGYYGGHPNPTRGNPTGAGLYTNDGSGVWRTSTGGGNPLPADWPPVSTANSVECDYQQPGVNDAALYTWSASTNGVDEYTASNFSGAMQGDLLAASFDGSIYRIELNGSGDVATNVTSLASGFGSTPLDVIAQGDGEPFGGTIWAVTYGANNITIFEPSDFVVCSGVDNPAFDEDSDGYSNADEIDNGTNPCSAASIPDDNDGDLVSDLNDPDDDDDTQPDTIDPFAIDASNGTTTNLPVTRSLSNNDPGTGFYGVGFTGLMTDGVTDYLDLHDPGNDVIGGGTSGLFTIPQVSSGDAVGSLNSQVNAYQFGVNVTSATAKFTIHARVLPPLFNGSTPVDYQSNGIYIGTGDQDDYLKLVINADGGSGGFQITQETAGSPDSTQYNVAGILSAITSVDLYLSVDPAAGTVRPRYAVDGGTVLNLGAPIALTGALLGAVQGATAPAVGIIATSRGSGVPFAATWDFINVTFDPASGPGMWETISTSNLPQARHENSFVELDGKLYLLGGRGIKPTQVYDPATTLWSNGVDTPIELHHIQAITYAGEIWVVAGYSGSCCSSEFGVSNIYIYNPGDDEWRVGPTIPPARRRGAAGVVVRNDSIYVVGGLNGGHGSTATSYAWFDVYDPVGDSWSTLPDAPRVRDHFGAVLFDDKIWAIGGRDSGDSSIFDSTIAEVDVYDFAAGSWQTLPASSNLPTLRGGSTTVTLGDEIIVIGGESATQSTAHNETEAFDPVAGSWRTLDILNAGRHGTQATILNNKIYIAAGSGNRGGGPELTSLERFSYLPPPDNNPPNASMTAIPPTGSVPLNVVFDGSSSFDPDGTIVSHVWDFGDGSGDSGSTVGHQYLNTGSYDAILTVTDNGGLSDRDTTTISVTTPPAAGTFLETGGLLVMEAENLHRSYSRSSHSWIEQNTLSGASDGAYMYSSPNSGTNIDTGYLGSSPMMVYEVEFATTGTYTLWLRAQSASGSDNSAHGGIDSTAVSSAARIENPTNGSWIWTKDRRNTSSDATIAVGSTGNHTIDIWMREDGYNVDKILLTTNDSFTPTGLGPAESLRVPDCNDSIDVVAGWNLVSVPCGASNMSADTILPDAQSSSFGFGGGYSSSDTLEVGVGYWVLFGEAHTYNLTGSPTSPLIPVIPGWNLVGPPLDGAAAEDINGVGTLILSSFYDTSGALAGPSTLDIGKAYWVRVSTSGWLSFPTN